jgi:ribonuclease III
MRKDLTGLIKSLEYSFKDIEFLKKALLHSSAKLNGDDKNNSNERLEFLGDRVLSLVIAQILLQMFPSENEGDLAKRHSALVKKHTLFKVAESLCIGDFIYMSEGEVNSGGRNNIKILSDCCEAIIAAIYLDGGLIEVSNFIKRNWISNIMDTQCPPKDYKTTLQEWCQTHSSDLPVYKEIERLGPPHKPEFIIQVSVKNRPTLKGNGTSKKEAEQNAAKLMLLDLKY